LQRQKCDFLPALLVAEGYCLAWQALPSKLPRKKAYAELWIAMRLRAQATRLDDNHLEKFSNGFMIPTVFCGMMQACVELKFNKK